MHSTQSHSQLPGHPGLISAPRGPPSCVQELRISRGNRGNLFVLTMNDRKVKP